MHPWPLIVDEVQYAPNLLEHIESIIDDHKVQGEDNKEIDLVMVKDGKISLIECKSGIEFGWNDIKAMAHGIPSQYPIGSKCVMCLTRQAVFYLR